MKTIAKNRTKLVNEIFGRAVNPVVLCLGNGFCEEDCSLEVIRKALDESPRTKLRQLGEKTYQVQVHSNLWYRFEA